MSILSTITGSLPNILNLLQGSWDVQYLKKIPLSEQDKKDSWDSIKDTNFLSASSIIASGINAFNIFEDGWQSLDFDSFIEMKEVNEATITKENIERGSFRSVNKVKKPKQIQVTIAKGGIGYGIEDTLSEIKSLLPKARIGKEKILTSSEVSSLLSLATSSLSDNSLSLSEATKAGLTNPITKKQSIPLQFRIITPFDKIDGLNLVKLDYTFKQDSGRNLLIMYLTFEEVIENTASVKSTNETVKNPTNSDKVNTGMTSLQS